MLNVKRLAELAEEAGWDIVKSQVTVSVQDSFDKYERGFKVEININYDDAGGESYNPEYLVFDENGVQLDDDADIGELIEEQVPFEV